MRASYLLDRSISRTADLLCPPFMHRARKSFYYFLAPLLGEINVPWCYWPSDDVVYQIVKVNPFDITHEIKDGVVPLKDNTKFWQRARRFKPHSAVIDMFAQGLPYSETEQYRTMIAKIDAGHTAYWCKTQKDVDTYFTELIDTYNSMKSNGYRRSESRDGEGAAWHGAYPNEILVSVDSQGHMYLERGGTHRLSIAHLLELKEVYVAVIREYIGTAMI